MVPSGRITTPCRRPTLWAAALSLGLHAGAVLAALALAAPPPDVLPPVVPVELVPPPPEEPPVETVAATESTAAAAPPPESPPTVKPKPVAKPKPIAKPKPVPPPPAPSPPTATVPEEAPAAAPGTAQSTAPPAAAAAPTDGEDSGKGHGDSDTEAITSYLAVVRTRIQRFLVYPPDARRLGLAGQVRLHFRILADGRIDPDSLRVVGGSDSGLLQDAALATLHEVESFPPPPITTMVVEVPVSFSLAARR